VDPCTGSAGSDRADHRAEPLTAAVPGPDPALADVTVAVRVLPRRRRGDGQRSVDHTGDRVARPALGEAHPSNFGVDGSPERSLVFDLNDFDDRLTKKDRSRSTAPLWERLRRDASRCGWTLARAHARSGDVVTSGTEHDAPARSVPDP